MINGRPSEDFFLLDPAHTDPQRMKKEREKARQLKKTHWWQQLRQKGLCHYCEKEFRPEDLTMDHVLPLARGGRSQKGNIVASCKTCNSQKKLNTPAEELISGLKL